MDEFDLLLLCARRARDFGCFCSHSGPSVKSLKTFAFGAPNAKSMRLSHSPCDDPSPKHDCCHRMHNIRRNILFFLSQVVSLFLERSD